MAKLHPPVIPGTIPAFSGTSIEVPFSMSRAVSINEISGLILKLKKVSGVVIGTAITLNLNNPASFSLENFKSQLAQGEYYKIQLAYISKEQGEIGHYSTVGVVKFTSEPHVFIEGLDEYTSNSHNYIYTGVYRQAEYNKDTDTYETTKFDTSEKLYSSRFYLYDDNYNLVQDSGEILHNANEDINSYEASDTFEYYNDFDVNKSYHIQYEITTSNGMVKQTPLYKLSQRRLRPMVLNAHLEVKNDFETGTVKVNLVQDSDELASGMFLLSRASSRAPQKWEPMKEFILQSEYPTRLLFTDYTVEQGITYKYALQQYNEHGVYSERRYSNEVIADFEDLFLYDGKRQLAIRFNPKVATFKQNRIEQKTETIGSQYPFIIKNGAVDYKELSISGLISYQMDSLEQFLSKDELELPYNKHDNKRYALRDLITDNIRAERLFKTEVLSWLQNGEVKLYRSPTEGNFVVRLMNVTTSPMDQLGRMLHTFNCAAYEMAKPTYDSLIEFGIITPEHNTMQTMRWKTVELRSVVTKNKELEKPQDIIQLNFGTNLGIEQVFPVYSIDLEGLDPGSYFLLGNSEADSKKIFIGATGSYHFVSEIPFGYIGIPATKVIGQTTHYLNYEGSLTFGYKGWVKSSFDLITQVQIINQPGHRFIGNAYSIYKNDNIIDYINNIKDTILVVKYMKLYSREIKPLYYDGVSNYYLTEKDQNHGGIPYTYFDLLNVVDKFSLYKIYYARGAKLKENQTYDDTYKDINNEDYYLDKSYAETPEYIVNGTHYLYYDPMLAAEKGNKELNEAFIRSVNDMELYNVNINNDITNMFEVFTRVYHGIEDVSYLSIGPGVIIDIGYDMQRSTYNFEQEDSYLSQLRQELENLQNEYFAVRRTVLSTSSEYANIIATYPALINEKYQAFKAKQRFYLRELEMRVNAYKEENDLNE